MARPLQDLRRGGIDDLGHRVGSGVFCCKQFAAPVVAVHLIRRSGGLEGEIAA